MRLRTFFIINAVLLVLLGVGSATGLFWMTTLLQRQTEVLNASLGQVRMAEELELSLFMLQVVRDAAERKVSGVGPEMSLEEAESQVQERLARIDQAMTASWDRVSIATIRTHVEAFLQARGRAQVDALRKAVDASDALVSASVVRARGIQEQTQEASEGARLAGTLLATGVLLGMGFVLYAARVRIYLPLSSLREALSAFKSGQRAWRVDRAGALELRELATEFNDMAETLASQEARHVQFLAGVVHDLRSPLNVLKLSAQTLLRPERLPPEEKVRGALTRILTQLGRLERMVGDLMDQTRVEAGNLELRWEESDLRLLTTEVVELHQLSSQRHQLQVSVPEVPVSLRCDPTRLSQVLTNLVGNAIKYSPDGGAVEVRLELSTEAVVIAISDEGVGIPSQDHERIFEPFQRSKRPDVNIPGIGLGLSVSRRIVRAHGGDIEVASREGGGSIFRVRLPSSPPAG